MNKVGDVEVLISWMGECSLLRLAGRELATPRVESSTSASLLSSSVLLGNRGERAGREGLEGLRGSVSMYSGGAWSGCSGQHRLRWNHSSRHLDTQIQQTSKEPSQNYCLF